MDNAKVKVIEESSSNKIGLIVSVSEMHQYYIETIEDGIVEYLKDCDSLKMFANVEDAKKVAKRFGCKKLYMCLDNTYDECGGLHNQDRFSYMPLS